MCVFFSINKLVYKCITHVAHDLVDVLPLVEFQLGDDISDEEALRLLDQEYVKPKRNRDSEWKVDLRFL